MPLKMYDLMWKEFYGEVHAWPEEVLYTSALCKFTEKLLNKHTYISQPEAIKLFQTSKKMLAHLRDDWGMPYVSVGIGSSERFFYKEEEVRTHLEELRGKK